jgi:hypothetical protein
MASMPDPNETPAVDLKLSFRMPGCEMTNEVDEPTERFFRELCGISLNEEFHRHTHAVLCSLIGAPSSYRARYCGLESGYRGARPNKAIERVIYAAGRSASQGNTRQFQLFISHAHPRKKGMDVRLAPFPTSMVLTVSDLGGFVDHPLIAGLTPTGLPEGIAIEILPLLARKEFYWEELKPAIRRRIVEAAKFYTALYDEIRTKSPRKAWDKIASQFPKVAADMPLTMKGICYSKELTKDQVLDDIRLHWSHPLDAPVLSELVYPEILAALDGDDELKHAPITPLLERDRYFRLHIPFEELEAQERYLGWLLDGRYLHEGGAIRQSPHAR